MSDEGTHLVSIVQKPAQEAQLQAMLEAFQPDRITLLVQTDSGRIDRESIQRWNCVASFSGTVVFEDIDFFTVTRTALRRRLEAFMPFNHVALPLYVGFPYWSNVRWLKRFSTVINLADGSTENTSIRDCFLRIKVKQARSYQQLKGLFLPPLIHALYRADICFFPFAPIYESCFSRKSLPAGRIHLSPEKAEAIKSLVARADPQHMLIGGFEHTPESIAARWGVSKYVATTKDKFIWLNGEKVATDHFICAEEVLEVFRPKSVIGCASDAVIAARLLYPDTPCHALESAGATEQWGSLYNEIYAKQSEKIGVTFWPRDRWANIPGVLSG